MTAIRVLITGRVQGVGFREWLETEATSLGLSGWLRNVGHDAVEALISGENSAVEACLQACRRGPSMAVVVNLSHSAAETPAETGFFKRASLPSLP